MLARQRGLLCRMAQAFNLSFRELGSIIGLSRQEVLRAITAEGSNLIDYNSDPMWEILCSYVDQRVGEILAIRAELERKRQKDNQRKLIERASR